MSTMKIQIASDLHLDLLQQRFPGYRAIEAADADVLVIAGDIHAGLGALDTFADWPVPVIYVMGNHEGYHHEYGTLIAQLRERSAGTALHFLERDSRVIGGVRFLGCCLWTDYLVTGDEPEPLMEQANRMLYDHRLIRHGEGLFLAADALSQHRQSRAWLEAELAQPFAGATVVVTHHGPHPGSVHPRYAGSPINAAFVSDLTPLMGRAAAWIHGHVHDSFDYVVNGTRVVANPRGYARNRHAAENPEQIEWENPLFDKRMVIEV
jgi:Calcineurin-like phosphoesterase